MYIANNELSTILINHGFIDTTSKEDKIKGRRSFKTSKTSKKEINFNYENIQMIKPCWSKGVLTYEELKSIIFYFTAKPGDSKEFYSSNFFSYENFQDKLVSLRNELAALIEFNLHQPRRNKIKRILDFYDNIIL